jgi:hypothetical protein
MNFKKNNKIQKFNVENISASILDLNLFNLHKEIDEHSRSWISFKGNNIKKLVKEIEDQIIKEKNLSREKLAKLLSKKLDYSFTSFKCILRGKREYYPIPIIKEIVSLCKNKKYLERIHSQIQNLKVNSASSREVKAIKTLTPDLCKIIGAFMADGSLTVTIIFASKNKQNLQKLKLELIKLSMHYNEWNCNSRNEYSICFTVNDKNQGVINKLIKKYDKILNIQSHYNLEITDEHKSNLVSFKGWIFNSFNVLPNSFKKKKNAWRLTYSNKIIARYFMTFFDIIPGPKASTAFEPQIIKNSPLEMRKLFARGVLMFDGSFTSAGKLSLSTKSKFLFESIKNILRSDNINIGTTKNRGYYVIFTYESTFKEKIRFYFEFKTYKWLRVNDFLETKNQSIENLIKRYKVYSNNKVTFKKLYDLIIDVKSCDLSYLSSHFNCSKHTLKSYLIILHNKGLIRVSRTPNLINEKFINSLTQILLKENIHRFIFGKIKKVFGTYKNFSNQVYIHKATISAWKLRKNRMELSILKKICSLCDVDFSIVLRNIENTDRKIIEAI